MNEDEIRGKIERYRERYRALEEWCDLEGALLNCDAADARLSVTVAMDAKEDKDAGELAMAELYRVETAIWCANIEKDLKARKQDSLLAMLKDKIDAKCNTEKRYREVDDSKGPSVI